MAERRYALVFYGAVLVAAVATYGVYRVLEATKASAQVHTQTVVVASQEIPEGSSIDRMAVRTAEFPVGTAPVGSFAVLDSVVGRVTRVPVFEGEPIVPGRLAPPGTSAGLEVKITPGKRAMGIRIDDVAGISGLILPNSRVDVLVALQDDTGDRQVAKLFMSNMRVLSVGTQVQRGQDGRAISATVATLEVTPDESERLAIASRQGAVQLVLRGYGDPDTIETRGATSSDVLSQLRSARPAPAPARASAPPRRAATPTPAVQTTNEIPRVVQAPPPRPDSVRVQIYRGAEKTEQKFEADSARRRTP